MRGRKPALLAVALALTASVPAAAADLATSGTQNGRIVFRRYLDVAKTTGAIFTVNPNGSKVTQVSRPRNGVIDTEPDWSADGTKIAFERQLPCPAGGSRDGMNDTCDLVYTVNRNGKGLWPLVACQFDVAHSSASPASRCVGVDQPGWSPDGRRIAFQYNLVDPNYSDSLELNAGIWVVDADGGNAHQVTQRTPGNSWDFGPQWSPSGDKLAFFRLDLHGNNEAIYTVNVDGTSEIRLTPKTLNAANPNWSPDGKWVLFTGEAGDGSVNIYKVHSDGSSLTNVTRQGPGGFHYLSASFSPNGAMIATGRTPGKGLEGAADVVTMKADGSHVRPVTKSRLWDSGADWGTAPLR